MLTRKRKREEIEAWASSLLNLLDTVPDLVLEIISYLLSKERKRISFTILGIGCLLEYELGKEKRVT